MPSSILSTLSPGNYVLQYLYSRPKLATFVVQGLVTLFARITKLGWFDSSKETENFVFRNVIADVTKFLQVLQTRLASSVPRYVLNQFLSPRVRPSTA